MKGPLDFNTSWWQDEIYASSADALEGEELDKEEDLLLPWSCCDPERASLAAAASGDEDEEDDEDNGDDDYDDDDDGSEVAPPKALPNTVRNRLKNKKEDGDEEDKEASTTAAPRPKTPHRQRVKNLIRKMMEEGPIAEEGKWCR